MIKYIPRNDFVLIRIIQLDESPGGIVLPQISLEGKQYVVEAIGPKVEDLQIGDRVLMIGTAGEDYGYVPNRMDLLVIKQANIVIVFREV